MTQHEATIDQLESVEKVKSSPAGAILLLVVAVVLGTFLRFFRLNQIPPGFTFDEASHAIDALDIMSGQFMLLSPRLRETAAGYMYLLAGAFQLFGPSVLVQRALTAVFGSLLIPISFLAVRTLFNEKPGHKTVWVAAFSALLLSSTFWGIMVSRKGFEYMLPPVFALTGVFFFWRGYRDERWGLLLAAGIFTATGFYIYHASAPFLLVIPTSIVLSRLLQLVFPTSPAAESPIRWKALLFFCLVLAIIALPLFVALTAGSNPEVGRSLRLSIFSQATGPTHWVELLGSSLVAHTQPFLALDGDTRWYGNLAGRPILDPILAICFVAGVLISLKRIRQLPYLFLLVYWVGMMAAPILTLPDTGSPLHFRMSGALPPTYVFIALAWTALYYWLKKKLASLPPGELKYSAAWLALTPFILVGLIWLPFDTYRDYFVTWANHPEVAAAHDVSILRLVEHMESETDPEAIFVLPRKATEPRPNYTLDFLYHGKAPLLYIPVDEATVRQTLTTELSNHQTVHLITRLVGGRERIHRRVAANALLPVLFEKYGELQGIEETKAYTIQTYQLDSSQVDFESHLGMGVPPDFKPLSFIIADQVKLAGINQHLEDNNLFVDLAWQGWTRVSKVTADYTVFVQLLDNDGQRVTGVDILPEEGFTTLDRQEVRITHHPIPLSDDMRPDTYTMLIGLYYFVGDETINVGSVTLAEPVVIE